MLLGRKIRVALNKGYCGKIISNLFIPAQQFLRETTYSLTKVPERIALII